MYLQSIKCIRSSKYKDLTRFKRFPLTPYVAHREVQARVLSNIIACVNII